MPQLTRFERAIALFDEANSADPRSESLDGVSYPRELLYAQRMTSWLQRLEPRASEILQLAARAQHLCRWEIARDEYPAGRRGYLNWRRELARFHADRAGVLLRQAGYSEQAITRVQALLRKEQLNSDAETQLLEDVACIVFLDSYFSTFAARQDRAKVDRILRKTWNKMSQRGREAALTLPATVRARLEHALNDN